VENKNLFLVTICLTMGTMVGCHKVTSVSVVTPSLYPISYTEAGGRLVWYPMKRPFTIVFPRTNPCIESKVSSDGNQPATCNVRKGLKGSYSYNVESDVKSGSSHPGDFTMRVGTCTSCTTTFEKKNRSGSAHAKPLPPIRLYCDGDQGKAEYSDQLVKVGDTVFWTLDGDDPPDGTHPFDIVIDQSRCASNAFGSCTVVANPPTSIPYTFTVNGCTQKPGSATLTVGQ
jgi:hypothetical protein